jgi:hypothetical protein
MPTFKIRKNGRVYSKTADSREEAIQAVLDADAQYQREAGDLADSQLDALDGGQAAPKEKTEIEKTFSGYMDAAGAMLSGIGGSIVGNTYGFGKGVVGAIGDGTYGTQEGVNQIRGAIDQTTDDFSRDAYTPEGRAVLGSIGEALDPLVRADQLGPLAAAIPTQPVRALPGAISRQAARATASDISDAVRDSGAAIADGTRATGRAIASPVTVPARAIQRNFGQPEANSRSIGAAEADRARQAQATAQSLPVPFDGDSQLTRGQLTRQNDQVQFERETAKRSGVGQPLQARMDNQQGTMHRNFDYLDDEIGYGGSYDDVSQGSDIRVAVQKYRGERKKKKDDAYDEAKRAGETNALVNPEGLGDEMQRLWHDSGMVPKNKAVIEEARRLNIIDDQGKVKPTTVDNLVKLRKAANRGYSPLDPNETYQRRQLLNAIDKSLDNTDAGPAYTRARQIAKDYYDEFDNSVLARDINSNKRGTNSSRIADENIASKIAGSSVQEIKQLERTMKSIPDGAREWRGVQQKFLANIRDKAFGDQTNSQRQPVLSPARFKATVESLDRSGKLEAILGQKMARDLRNMVEVSDSIATGPPGTINHSNSSSAIWNFITAHAGIANPKNAVVGHLYGQARDHRKVKKSLDGQSLLEGL